MPRTKLTSIELCAGAGGQALGVEQAGFSHLVLSEIDAHCRATLRLNRPLWNVPDNDDADITTFDASAYKGVDLVAAGLPCPPFSIAGKQLGQNDERNLFPAAIEIISTIRPKAVMIENVRGFLGAVFSDYRSQIKRQLEQLGYETEWRLFNSSDFGVPQLRPRVIIVAIRKDLRDQFVWPVGNGETPPTVGVALQDLMKKRKWKGARAWVKRANEIAPTIVGGSKKHGGPDLGPSRARAAWATLGVNGKSLAEEAPDPDFVGMPRLTVQMVARLQGFPDEWEFTGRKTAAYRQVGNAFPPPVACAVASSLRRAITLRKALPVRSIAS